MVDVTARIAQYEAMRPRLSDNLKKFLDLRSRGQVFILDIMAYMLEPPEDGTKRNRIGQ